MSPQYWLVGATWGTKKDVLPQFITRGYWYCWDASRFSDEKAGAGNAIKNQQDRFRKVLKGDRIAVKRMLGQGEREMAILAVGIVKDVDLSEWRIYVDWVATNIDGRRVPLNGCLAAIHGPFNHEGKDSAWINQVFCL